MSKKGWGLIIIGVIVVLGFQNCGTSLMSSFRSFPSSSVQAENPLPFDHPDVDIVPQGSPVQGRLVMGDQVFLESVFRDIFAPTGTREDIVGYVNAVLYQEFTSTQNMLGRGCDLNEEGSLIYCYESIANIDTSMGAGTSSIREAARVQVCRRIIANSTVVEPVISAIRGNQSTPNQNSIEAMIQLFFPAGNAPNLLNSELLGLDAEMASAGETLNNRWSILLLTLCESPAWQVL